MKTQKEFKRKDIQRLIDTEIGDYVTVTIDGEPVTVVKVQDGSICANCAFNGMQCPHITCVEEDYTFKKI